VDAAEQIVGAVYPETHLQIEPPILYFGTPVVLLSTLNEEGTANPAPMSSAWALGYTVMLGLGCGETEVIRVHAHREIVMAGTNYVDPTKWKPLFYVFRHYFSSGSELGKTFRAET
jgi:flavin reductase (DIM6/NTAB) family NADH-FMN oxidoreductase RutF